MSLPIELMLMDVRRQNALNDADRLIGCFDTVIMNPPFGTRNKGYGWIIFRIYYIIS
jgi:predicted RNA methylase